jgi:hypothetical protein
MHSGWSRTLFGLGILAISGGCRDLSRFSTREGEAYCGKLVSAPAGAQGFLPEGEPPSVAMRLVLAAAELGSSPGRITTNDANRGYCSPRPLFDEAPLRAVSEAAHDAISQLEFGDGREYNGLYWIDSRCKGSMLGVLSLMKSEKVELRLFKPGALGTSDGDQEGFVQFDFTRRAGGCF